MRKTSVTKHIITTLKTIVKQRKIKNKHIKELDIKELDIKELDIKELDFIPKNKLNFSQTLFLQTLSILAKSDKPMSSYEVYSKVNESSEGDYSQIIDNLTLLEKNSIIKEVLISKYQFVHDKEERNIIRRQKALMDTVKKDEI